MTTLLKSSKVLELTLFRSVVFKSQIRAWGWLPRPQLFNCLNISTLKTGSEWIKRVLADSKVRSFSHMDSFRGRWLKYSRGKLPPYTFTVSTGLRHQDFQHVKISGDWRGIYVFRDPRDILVSWYFSMLHSHSMTNTVETIRNTMDKMDKNRGLHFALKRLNERGFNQMRSWLECNDSRFLFISYESLVQDPVQGFQSIFSHFLWPVPQLITSEVTEKYSFQNQSGGRSPGEEDIYSHQRKGCTGDWINYFTPELKKEFKDKAQDLLEGFGYEDSISW